MLVKNIMLLSHSKHIFEKNKNLRSFVCKWILQVLLKNQFLEVLLSNIVGVN